VILVLMGKVKMDELDKYVADNIKAEVARVGIACIKASSVEIADVAAMLDSEAIRLCVQAVCIGAPNEDIGAAFQEAVKASIGMVAELNLIKKFDGGL